jgi:PAS domain S-box-containing protein
VDRTVTILLVEDNPADVRLIQETLTSVPDFPFSLEQASKLSTGIEQLTTQDPDVILLDLMLPDSHGLDTFTKIQAQAPQKPIIVLSGLNDQDLADKAVRKGAQDYLVKGQIDGDLLVRAIHYAIERKQSEVVLRRRTRELELLNRAGQTLSSILNLDQVLATVLEEVRHLLGVMAASVWLIAPETGELVCRQATGSQNEIVRGWRLAPGEGLVGWVVRNGKSLIVPDVQTDERHSKRVDQETGLPLRSVLSIPLKAKQKVIGVLQVADTDIACFDTADLELLEPLAAAAAIAIENAQLYAETDRLRAFNENIVQSLEEGILLEDVAGQITFVNRKAAELLGYKPEELIGRHWADIVAPGHQADIEAGGTNPAEGTVIRYETVLLAQDGRLISAIVSARWLYEEGRLAGVLSAFTDISARRRAEEALRESEEKYRTLFESSPESIILVSPDGTILDCNDTTAEITGMPREEMIGKPAADLGLLQEEDISPQLATLSQIAGGEKASPYELKIREGKDARWLEIFPTPLTKTGDLYAIQIITRDVTKRRWTEEKIRQRNEELTALNAIAAAVSQSLDQQAVLKAALQETMLALNAEGGIVYLFDKDSQSFTPTIHHGLSPQVLEEIGTLKLGAGSSERAVKSGQPLFVADVAQESHTIVQEGWQSLISVPLESAGNTVGVMTIVSHEKDRFGPERLGMLSAIGNQIGVAIENAQLFEAVNLGRERLQILSQRLVEVQENERRYIARELHDEIGQYLTGLKLVLDMATRSPGGDGNDNLKEALALADELMAQVRNLSLDLRPTMLDDLGLLPALLWHCGRYTDQTGVHVDLRHTNLEEQRFRSEVETAAYRIVQEALTNVARHAEVDKAVVRLWIEQDALSVQVTDQGTGFNPDNPLISDTSSGLVGMRERAVLLGGELTIESAPGAGTCLTAKLPLGDTTEQQE